MLRFAPCATALVALCSFVPTATAQVYVTDFESVSASAAGTMLTGQDGYYIPPATTSIDFLAYTYAGNALGLPMNPFGGNNFIGGTGPAGATYARAQRAFPWAQAVYTMGFDVLGHFGGTLPTANNVGSVSLQPSTGSAAFIALATWTDVNTGTNWNAGYVYYDAAGVSVTAVVPDPAFQGLAVDRWYRWETDFDLATNLILEVRLVDLTTGAAASYAPTGWYLGGGAVQLPLPTDFRFFGGGGVAGNTLAFDNMAVGPRATYDAYGSGCAGSNGTPTLAAATAQRPQVGRGFTVDLTNLPTGGSAVFAVLGFSSTNWGGLTLPFDLSVLGMTGCFALADVTAVYGLTATGASTTWSIGVPNNLSLLGVDIYNQALVTDPGANGLGVTASNGGHGRIGV